MSCHGDSLPEPSIIVSTGNGCHLYWLLETPYLIDDAKWGEPPPVQVDWIERNGKKKRLEYFVDPNTRERLYLTKSPQNIPELSPKALVAQDIMAGIAAKIGGDHTQDISRILRVPGTLNRKDARNGRPPKPCRLVKCRPEVVHQFDTLRKFADVEGHPRKKLEKTKQEIKLPKAATRVRKGQESKLRTLANQCAVAQQGERSERDFAICCYAIEEGICEAKLRDYVRNIGKFAESGEDYFSRTFQAAENHVRERIATEQKRVLDKASQKASELASPEVVIDPSNQPVCALFSAITNKLLETDQFYSRQGHVVSVRDGGLKTITKPDEFIGAMTSVAEIVIVTGSGDKVSQRYEPLPKSYASGYLHSDNVQRLPEISLFSRNPVYSNFELVPPGYCKDTGIYYSGPPVEPRSDREHLDSVLADFCWEGPADRTNYVGILLTIVLMPRFVGSKPLALFVGNQPGLGKSILAQIIAILRMDPAETVTYNPNDEEFEKRLAAVVRRGSTTIIVDNAKAAGRTARIDSAVLERSITDKVLSYRLLGQTDSIRAENSHLFCITANTPDVSDDIVRRSLTIGLHHEGAPRRRRFSIADPERYAEENREAIWGELIGMVERWKDQGMPLAETDTRFNKKGWGNLIGGILKANGLDGFLANAEGAAVTLDETRRDFEALVESLASHQQGNWTAAELVKLCESTRLLVADLGEGSARSKATKMGAIAGRFVNEVFLLAEEGKAVFRRTEVDPIFRTTGGQFLDRDLELH